MQANKARQKNQPVAVGGDRSVALRATLRWRAFPPKEPIPRARNCPVAEDQYPFFRKDPYTWPRFRRGFSLCPNIGNHLPRSRICFGAEERNSPRVIIGKASSPALRPGGRGFLDPNRGGPTSEKCGKGEPLVAAGVRPVRVLEPPAPAAITRLQVLLAWDDRIANGRIAPAIAVAQQA
jgi:hypothetical protein